MLVRDRGRYRGKDQNGWGPARGREVGLEGSDRRVRGEGGLIGTRRSEGKVRLLGNIASTYLPPLTTKAYRFI